MATATSQAAGRTTRAKANKEVGAGATATAPVAIPAARVRRTKSDARKVDERLAAAFKQLGDVTRLRVIRHLANDGATNVTELCEAMGMTQPAVSHHLALLRHGGLIESTRCGKNNMYNLTPRGLVLAGQIVALAGAQ